MSEFQIRPYQTECLETIVKLEKQGVMRQLVKMPTGTGKTEVFAQLPRYLDFADDQYILTLVHREELANQGAGKLAMRNPTMKVGIEMADQYAHNCRLVVGSVPTLGKKGSERLNRFNPAKCRAIIIDEAHHATAASYQNILNHFDIYNRKDILLVGVTATPNRSDGKGLGAVFEQIVYNMSILDAIRQGWLVDLKGIKIETKNSLDGVKSKANDWDLGELSKNINTPELNDLAVQSWIAHGKDAQTAVFAVDVQHAKDLADCFKRYGVSAEAIWGGDPDRQMKLKLHREKSLRVIVNCELLVEGYDDWQIACIMMVRPTQSESLYTQIMGRGTRIPAGITNLVEARAKGIPLAKESCILIDMVHNSSKHSLVTLPSLFGLNGKADLKGKMISKVMDQVEKIKKDKPFVDLTKVEDINKLDSYAKEIDLFHVSFPPEILQLSKYQWHRAANDTYILLLKNGDSLVVAKDLLDKWDIRGTIDGSSIEARADSLEGAIEDADYKVKMYGGKSYETLVRHQAKWHGSPPTPSQLNILRRHRIPVPPNATRGECHMKISAIISARKAATVVRA